MRPKVWIAACGALALFALGTYLYVTAPAPVPTEAQLAAKLQKKSVTIEVVEPAKAFEEFHFVRTEIAGTLRWILVNPSYKDGLLSVAIKTSEDYDIFLGKWDATKKLELKLTHTHPSSRVRVAISDYLGRLGPGGNLFGSDVASITVRNSEDIDPDGFGTTVQTISGQYLSSSAALAGAVLIEFFYD